MSRNWEAARLKVRHEGSCRVCGSIANIEAAHIVPRSLGGGMDSESIVPLCRSCHHSYDDHKLDLIPYLTKAEQAAAVLTIGLGRAYERLGGKAAA